MTGLGGTHVIAFGNPKGGTGKSTTAMHLVVALLRMGWAVATIDLDHGQASLTRYVENRRRLSDGKGLRLPLPTHRGFEPSTEDNRRAAAEDECQRLDSLLADLAGEHEFIVIDTPGSDSELARHAMSYADTLITPLNDSFIDFDILGRVEGSPLRVLGPSRFSEAVWRVRQARAARDGGSIDWIVMRNRLSSTGSRNSKRVETVLAELAKRIGFRVVGGFGERVIFRELFVQGLTVLDLREKGVGVGLNLSHVGARQEVRRLLDALGLDSAEAESPAKAEAQRGETPTLFKTSRAGG
ncbi:MAG: division plane positioning ATPase MipZ [Alphaproteobacteria bacterium]